MSESHQSMHKGPLSPALRNWVDDSMLPPLEGLTIWDIGSGWGDFTAALLDEGAANVISTDISLDFDHISDSLCDDRRVTFAEGTVEELAPKIYQGDLGGVPDLLFMHLMTEHVFDLRAFFVDLRTDLPENCEVFVHHDNFYQPAGHHDHKFVALDPATYTIEPQTVPCWTLAERCRASTSHRDGLPSNVWGPESAATVGGECENCNYRIRSEPWAHLTHQARFREVWPEAVFSVGTNKLTTFQVRQYMIEAGFDIVDERRVWVSNNPSEYLLGQFTAMEMATFAITFRARAGELSSRDPDVHSVFRG